MVLFCFLIALAGLSSDDGCKVPASDKSTSAARTAPAKRASPFACDRLALTPAERKRHFEELGPMLRAAKNGVRELPEGYEFRFPADRKTFALLAEWVDQERLCCPFLDLSLRFEPEGGPLWMRVTGRPGTKEFLRADSAAWISK